MIFEVPILIQPRSEAGQEGWLYSVRPLFFESPEMEDRDLSNATRRLEQKLREELRSLARAGEHSALANYTFAPDLSLRRLDIKLELRRGMHRCQLVVVTFKHEDRWIGFSPYLGDVWFDIESEFEVSERTTAVMTRYFRDLEKLRETVEVERQLLRLQTKKKPSLGVLELEIDTRVSVRKPMEEQFALLSEATAIDGAEQLRRVGRSLHELYPDRLTRAVRRDELVQTLCDLLAAPDNRPVLLVGRPLVGKTTLVHEAVFREMAHAQREPEKSRATRSQVWQIAPQRLVTGMSFVGQWENRWLAILRHARKRRHVLYFDDLVGLFQAGITSQSNLSAADVLKPYVERREVRLLAEMTPEQLRILRERDRGFADMFHVLPVEEPTEEATVHILLGVIRWVEAQFRVQFHTEVLPTVLDLTRRYQSDTAFPGKAAAWLGQLAVKYRGRAVSRQDVMQEFHTKSGLQLGFIDSRQQLPREEIFRGLRSRIIGQQEAVEAMVDVVSIAKARLNDPHRPLGSLFFLGPTGVGKTECAKALACYLFGDESRLLRFDMNEFVSPYAAARLVGTFDQPEGLLTAAVRHQPFCVLLFDEIEKAHPDVFDLLLQVLGEARLTEALGRTADFSNAVVILTSNLGTRESSRELGFGGSDEASAESTFQKAVQDFFRPEFFNRLDRIVPFRRLSREQLAQIAQSLVLDATSRHGLVRRKCVVDISADALERLIERGYDPALGARAIRRSVESELVSPLARQLASVIPDTPTVLEVTGRSRKLSVQVTALVQSEPWPETSRPTSLSVSEDRIAKARLALDRIMHACEAARPQGEILAGAVAPQFAWYLGMMELVKDSRVLLSEIAEVQKAAQTKVAIPILQSKPSRRRMGIVLSGIVKGRHVLKEIYAAEDVRDYCRELASQLQEISPTEDVQRSWLELLDRLAFLDAIKPNQRGWQYERALLLVRSPDTDPLERKSITNGLLRSFSWQAGSRLANESVGEDDGVDFGLESAYWPPVRNGGQQTARPAAGCVQGPSGLRPDLDVIVIEGSCAVRLAKLHEGTHLLISKDGRLHVYQVVAIPIAQDETVEQVLHSCLVRDETCREALSRGEASGVAGPFAWQCVVSLVDKSSGLDLDFRYERNAPGGWDRISRLLALPPELQD